MANDMMSRRDVLARVPAVLAAGSYPTLVLGKVKGEDFDYILIAREAKFRLGGYDKVHGLGYDGSYPAPVLRARQGQRLRVKLVNQLSQATTIHWHGIRIANAMDGVPFLTQEPIQPGKSFVYDFVPPDAGTFWYHPHINSVEQLSKGLTGVLIVEETKKPDFDQDVLLQFKNWDVSADRQLKKLFSLKKAARCGTMGPVFTLNGKTRESIAARPGDRLRLRLVNMDVSRVYHVNGLESFDARLIAIDGVPLDKPQSLSSYDLGAGMRVDLSLVFRSRFDGKFLFEGKGAFRKEILEFRTVGKPRKSVPPMPSLPKNPIPVPELKRAEVHRFVFEWSAGFSPKGKGHAPSFWAMNRIPWEGISKGKIPPPLVGLKKGRSYVFELENRTPNRHPIHLHGLFFRVDWSNQKKLTPYFADTVLMDKNEKVRIAFVADNPGRWMFHCHIIEHMKTGFMGYISIS